MTVGMSLVSCCVDTVLCSLHDVAMLDFALSTSLDGLALCRCTIVSNQLQAMDLCDKGNALLAAAAMGAALSSTPRLLHAVCLGLDCQLVVAVST